MEKPRLTIFSLPKAFDGHIAVIQRNALHNWSRLSGCEVIVCGDENGVAEAAASVGARHLPDIRRNEFGTPFLDDTFRKAAAAAAADHLCYVNSDILFADSPVDVLERIRAERFLVIGRRIDLDVTETLDTSHPGWRDDLMARASAEGVLQSGAYMDYFLFPCGDVAELPAFLVGRPRWDGWMVYNALNRGRMVIDATEALRVVHQNHDYAHIPQWRGVRWDGPEADWNLARLDNPALDNYIYSVRDATHRIATGRVRPRLLPYVRRTARWLKKRLGIAYNPLPV